MFARTQWALVALLIGAPTLNAGDNELTAEEKNEGYVLLFDGKDLKGWHRTAEGFGGWKAEDGAICLTKGGGMLWADGQYDNFVLKVDFRMSKGCNSGVFLRTGDSKDPVQTGIEIQVYDDAGKQPSKHSCGAIYDLVAPSKVVTRPAGEWNSFVITANKTADILAALKLADELKVKPIISGGRPNMRWASTVPATAPAHCAAT